tara:strand:- start:34275 stop:34529 length:255 start_codon:yes stop_codon:yes gene_type:complete
MKQIIEKSSRSLWNNLNEPQKNIAKKAWKIITYKWQWQIAMNIPFIIWWTLHNLNSQVHEFDMNLIHKINPPTWVLTFLGLNIN